MTRTSMNASAEFAEALLEPESPVPGTIVPAAGHDSAQCFQVYRNNVVIGLVEALASRFAIVRQIVGAEFFGMMARAFVDMHKPASPMLFAYGDDFGDFIARFAPADEVVYLADIARLEARRTRSYHAADAPVLDAAELADIDPEVLTGQTFKRHPAAFVVRSPHPIVSIWAMNCGDIPLAQLEEWTAQDALVARPHLNVNVHQVPEGGAVFLDALFSGSPLGEAAGIATESIPGFDLTANLVFILQTGALGSLRDTANGGAR